MAEYVASSQALTMARLSFLQVAILQPDTFSCQLVRKTLSNIGITHTVVSRDSKELGDILTSKPIDLLVLDWETRPEPGRDVLRYVRSPESPNRTLPIIMTTAINDPVHHADLRNAGVNEVLAKPFAMKAVLECVTSIIDAPREFIIAPNYVGPCRRRTPSAPPEGVAERRGQQNPVPIEPQLANEVFLDGIPRLLPANYNLKTKLESAAGAKPTMIDTSYAPTGPVKSADQHYRDMQNELVEIRTLYQSILAGEPQEVDPRGRLGRSALALRSSAVASGYVFAARVANALYDFCRRTFSLEDAQHRTVVEYHINTLAAIIQQRISGDEHETGRVLVEELKRLVRIYTSGKTTKIVDNEPNGAAAS